MLEEFWRWWVQHLLELVPEALRQGSGADVNALVVDAGGDGSLVISRRRRGVEQKLTSLRLDEPGQLSLRAQMNGRPNGEPVVLRLPPNAALERQVSLPLAAEREMERVLGYEMERLTPFAAEEVFWGASVEARDRARGKLAIRLTIIPRTGVQTLIETLAEAAGRPSLIEAATPAGLRRIKLQHEARSAGIGRLSPRLAASLLGGLAALAVISPFLRQALDLHDARAELETLRPRMALVDNLRRRIQGAGAGGDVVANETKRLGDAMGALAAITDILPDDSYLTEFALRERKITISGLGNSAPKLISLLSADNRVKNPAFTAPVTRNEQAKRDVFSIRADLAQ